jgi:hypothetical protein
LRMTVRVPCAYLSGRAVQGRRAHSLDGTRCRGTGGHVQLWPGAGAGPFPSLPPYLPVDCCTWVQSAWWQSRRNIRPAGCTVRRLARILCVPQIVVTVCACVRRSCGALTRQQHASLILTCRLIHAQSPAVRTMSSLFSEPAISLGIRCARVFAAACKSGAGMAFCSVLTDQEPGRTTEKGDCAVRDGQGA